MRNLICLTFLFLTFNFSLAYAKTDYRCGVRLIFDSDGSGSVANYVLSLQVKNTTGRAINGISVIYKDLENNVIGNTFLNCSFFRSFFANLQPPRRGLAQPGSRRRYPAQALDVAAA